MNATQETAMRVVVADDSALFRDGLSALLEAAGVEVAAQVGDVPAALAAVATLQPDVAVLDVRMPPDYSDEGISAAIRIRAEHPQVGVLVLSTYAESEWAARLLTQGASGLGYLLKDRVDDVATLLDALQRIAGGGTAVDPQLVATLLGSRGNSSPLTALSDRELDVLQLMAEGLSNAGIGRRLHLSPRTVESHIAMLFTKLDLPADADDLHRRVVAVLTFLRHS